MKYDIKIIDKKVIQNILVCVLECTDSYRVIKAEQESRASNLIKNALIKLDLEDKGYVFNVTSVSSRGEDLVLVFSNGEVLQDDVKEKILEKLKIMTERM